MLHAGLDLRRRRLDVFCLTMPASWSRRGGAGRGRVAPSRHARAGGARSGGDRVDERRAVRARHAGGARLGCVDRRRAEGQGPGAAGLQDRQDRRARVGRVVLARSGAGDLAARPGDPPRTRARAVPAASGPAPHDAQEPHPRDADRLPVTRARSQICSATPAASCSIASRSPIRGDATSTSASL